MSEDYKKQQAILVAETIKKQDIVITTALIPGKKAPVLVTEDMVKSMKPGAVIVDLAVEQGGNCALSKPDQVVIVNGVHIVGITNMPSRIAVDASALYARNLLNFLTPLVDKETKNLKINWEDDIVKASALTRDGAIIHPNFTEFKTMSSQQFAAPAAHLAGQAADLAAQIANLSTDLAHAQGGAVAGAPFFVTGLTVFVLSCFVGYYVVWRVTPALHSPLMAVTNAISSVIIVGALIAAGPDVMSFSKILGFFAVILASVNIFGGFIVTRRMLQMFSKKKAK